jgi:hypothetical protein
LIQHFEARCRRTIVSITVWNVNELTGDQAEDAPFSAVVVVELKPASEVT